MARPTEPMSSRPSPPARPGSRSTRTACATSTITTHPTTRSTRSIPSSCGRTSPRGLRCSRHYREELSRSRNSITGVEPRKRGGKPMRILIAVPALLVLGACNVTKDGNAVTVQYDQNTAENTAADIGNSAQNIAADIGNDVTKTGDKLQNKVGNADINVKIGNDSNTENKTENKTEKKK